MAIRIEPPKISQPEKSVSLRRQPDAHVIDESLAAGDDDQEDRLGGDGVLDAERRAEGAHEEGPGADVDGAEHSDQAEQVQPGGDPAGAAVAEDRAPVIEAAGRRVGRADLGHGDGEDQADEAADQPADADADAADPEVACASELMPPPRMQMIEKEMAKFEKRLRLRCSSWA